MGMRESHSKPEPDVARPIEILGEGRTRIGVLGGTFDPIHYGHLVIAEEARVQLHLQRVLFVPAGTPPHKLHERYSSADARRRMVELAIASNPRFEISLVELTREGPSYSVDTLRLLHKELGPDADFYFIMGLDSLAGILTWYEPQQLLELCYIVAASRPGYGVDLNALEDILPGISTHTILLKTPELNISASNLQQRVREGLPIKYQTPEPVEEYIYRHELYRDTGA